MKVRCIFAICSKKQHDITPRNHLSSTTRNAKLFIVNKQYVFSLSLTTKGHIAFSYPYFPDHQVQNIDRSNVLSLFCEFCYHNCRNLNLCIVNFSSVWTDWNLILESDVALPSSLFTLLVGLKKCILCEVRPINHKRSHCVILSILFCSSNSEYLSLERFVSVLPIVLPLITELESAGRASLIYRLYVLIEIYLRKVKSRY